MAQFLGDIAGMLEIFAVAGGLVLLHFASKDPPAKLMKAAGLVLVVGGVAVGLCTSFYWFQYRGQGHFERASPPSSQAASGETPSGRSRAFANAAPRRPAL